MPSNSVIKAELKKKKTCMQKVLIFEKNLFTSWIWIWDLLNASQLLYPLSHMAVVFNGMLLKFSPLLCLQPAAEHNLITALTRSDKREAGGWWVYDVRQLMCCYEQSQVSYWHDGRTDRQIDGRIDRRTAFQLYIYRLPYCIIETCRWKRVPLGPDNKIIPFPMFDAATY